MASAASKSQCSLQNITIEFAGIEYCMSGGCVGCREEH